MFEMLKNILDTSFEKELFNAAFRNLIDKQNKIRCCNFAYALRSLIDCIFENRIAPDEKVKKAPWYKKESDDRDVTRRQRYKYSIQGETDDYFINEIIKFDDLDEITRDFNSAVHSLSKYTHISEKTFNLSEKEIDLFVKVIDNAISLFLSNIFDIKSKLSEKLNIWLWDLINDTFMSTTIQEIDELCTHYLIDYVDIESVEFINEKCSSLLWDISKPIDIEVTGQIGVEHQFGSDGDYKRGDGLRYDASYPYKIEFKIKIPSIKEIMDDEEEYDNIKNYTHEEKNELNELFLDEFYENIQLISYDIDTSKHFE